MPAGVRLRLAHQALRAREVDQVQLALARPRRALLAPLDAWLGLRLGLGSGLGLGLGLELGLGLGLGQGLGQGQGTRA